MAVSREERRTARRDRAVEVFGHGQAQRALDLLEIVELAWHDCYDDVTPPDEIIDDMFLLSGGDLQGLIAAARLALTDWRDLRVAATAKRERGG